MANQPVTSQGMPYPFTPCELVSDLSLLPLCLNKDTRNDEHGRRKYRQW